MRVVVVGGAGAMGQVIVRDLAESGPVESVVIADFNQGKADELKAQLGSRKLSTAFADIRDAAKMAPALEGADVVINSTPYYFNLNVMEAALASGVNYMDLGGLFHVTRRQLELNDRFKAAGLLAVLGMGAAPGMTNIMARAAADELDVVESIDIIIGCVDFVKVDHPLAPPYSIDTLIDEYTKEPMVFDGGEFAAVPPMSGEITVDFPQPVGRAKAILTLHSEVATLPLVYKHKGVKRVTFRLGLPEEFHEKLKFLMELGLGGSEELTLDAGKAVPRKVLAKLIERFPMPATDPDDCEVVRVDVAGVKGGERTLIRMETTVLAHKEWKMSCGALDTGVPPSIVAQMIGSGLIKDKGVLAPESCVPPAPFFEELARRTMIMRRLAEKSPVAMS